MNLTRSLPLVWLLLTSLAVATGSLSAQDKAADQAATAIYADAANFQTNGATELAIEQWI